MTDISVHGTELAQSPGATEAVPVAHPHNTAQEDNR